MSKLENASVLAFERKLDPSDALFYAGPWEERAASQRWPHVEVREKSVRGTISNRLKTKDQDPLKLDAMIENPNLQTVDVATLPHDADTLKVSFTLRVLAGVGTVGLQQGRLPQQAAANHRRLPPGTRLWRTGTPLCRQPGQWPLPVAQPRGRRASGSHCPMARRQGRASLAI
jgi:hypothetical protein